MSKTATGESEGSSYRAATSAAASTSTSTARPAPDFTQIDPFFHVHCPSTPPTASSGSSSHSSTGSGKPDYIILLGWMDAPLRLVLKYATPYASLYPNATILLLLSTSAQYFRGQQGEGIVGLQSWLSRETEKAEQGGRRLGVHIHSFSDGGASNLHLLLSHLSSLHSHSHSSSSSSSSSSPSSSFFPTSLILDSSPSSGSAANGAKAFTIPFFSRTRNPFGIPLPYVAQKTLATLLKGGAYVVLSAVEYWNRQGGRGKTWHDVVKESINDPRSWQWQWQRNHSNSSPPSSSSTSTLNGQPQKETTHTDLLPSSSSSSPSSPSSSPPSPPPRLYLYSQSDELIEWQSVEAHASDFAQKCRLPGPVPLDVEGGPGAGPGAGAGPGVEVTPLDLEKSFGRGGEEENRGGKGAVYLRRWTTAAHCSLVRGGKEGDNEAKYWASVKGFLSSCDLLD